MIPGTGILYDNHLLHLGVHRAWTRMDSLKVVTRSVPTITDIHIYSGMKTDTKDAPGLACLCTTIYWVWG